MRKKPISKNVLFAIIALMLPVAFFVILELTLRFTLFYQSNRVFIPLDGYSAMVILNPDYPNRFFSDFTPSVALNPFTAVKNPGSYRVFVLGGSSTAGYPFSFAYSFPAQLELILKKSMPDMEIEVINLGMTAVNSYTVWHLNLHLLKYEPDLIIIYSGHNEYYGAMGVQSGPSYPPWLKRAGLRSKDLAIGQVIRTLIDYSKPNGQNSKHHPETKIQTATTMQRRLINTDIQYGDPIYYAGIRQFESNIKALLKHNHANEIPTVLMTLISNLQQPPFDQSIKSLEIWNQANQLLDAGQNKEALDLFKRAKDHDAIRFRAPEAINEVIRSMSYTQLVDIEAEYYSQPYQAHRDNEFFTDHLHPDADGYRFFAETLARHFTGKSVNQVNSDPDPFESLLARTHIDILKTGWPFNRNDYDSAYKPTDVLFLLLEQNEGLTGKMVLRYLTEGKNPAGIYRDILNQKDTISPGHLARYYYTLSHWIPQQHSLFAEAWSVLKKHPLTLHETEALLLRAATQTDQTFYFNLLGAFYLQDEQMDSAKNFLDIVEIRTPNDKDMLLNMAHYYILKHDTTSAKNYFSRYQRAIAARN